MRGTFATGDSSHGNKESLLSATTHRRKPKDKQSPAHTDRASPHKSVIPSPSPLANMLRHATWAFSPGLHGAADGKIAPSADECTFQKESRVMARGLHCALSTDDFGDEMQQGREAAAKDGSGLSGESIL